MRKNLLVTLFLIIAMLMAACAPAPTPAATEAPEETDEPTAEPTEAEEEVEETAEATEEATEEPTAEPTEELSALERAMNGEFEGETVSIFGKWIDAEGEAFEAALAPFEEATGIDVEFEGSQEFETLITVRAEAGDLPDIAHFPQPGLMAEFVESGDIVDHAALLDVEQLEADYAPAYIEMTTVDGQLSGVVYRASTKSIVWYPVEAFEAAGYEAPTSWDEMIALSDQIVEEQGVTPWCVSMEHESNTGWVATDWIEDVLLRTASPEIYDQWVAHEIPFDHPEVVEAAKIVEEIWFNESYVYGGTDGILSIWVGDTQTPMFEDPPQCWFHKQAGWIPGFWPEGTEAGVDSSFFYLPPIEEEYGSPVLGSGDIVSAFNDRPETAALMQYLASPEGAEEWIKLGGLVSPNNRVELDWYPTYVDAAQAEILQNATTLRFDASDSMPAEVGVGSFWSGMIDWVSGTPIEDVLAAIEASWPTE